MLALLPSLVALVLAFVMRNAVMALGAGALVGALLVNINELAFIPNYLLEIFILSPIQSTWKMGALLLTLQLGAFSAVLEYNGNLESIFKALQKSKSPSQNHKKTSLTTLALMGVFCFYDGLANSILLGKISQSLSNKIKVSKEYLAYIVDTTSSSVACLVFFSTWTAYQLTLIQENIPQDLSPLSILIKAIPFNIYSWLSLLILFVVIRKNLLIGPLKKFEAVSLNNNPSTTNKQPQHHELPTPTKAVAPLLILFLSFLLFVLALSWQNQTSFTNTLSSAQIPWLLNLSATTALASIFILKSKSFSASLALRQALSGLIQITKPCLILFCAWALSHTLRDLGLARELSHYFSSHNFSISWLPAIAFLASCLLSFFTGTSWGTLAIMMPLALPIVVSLDPQTTSLIPITIGAVFGGAVFGDHCSPLSDTTVVSSFATGSTVRNHVQSQIPYAVLCAAIALLAFYIPYALFS